MLRIDYLREDYRRTCTVKVYVVDVIGVTGAVVRNRQAFLLLAAEFEIKLGPANAGDSQHTSTWQPNRLIVCSGNLKNIVIVLATVTRLER